MRVTTKMFYDRFLSDLQKNLSAMYDANEKLSTGKRINRPSDDPAGMARIVGYKATLLSIGQYNRSIDSAKSYLGALDGSFVNLTDVLTRSRELAVQGANATVDASSRIAIGKEVRALFETSVGIANTKVGDRYIFSGYLTNSAPISANTGEFQGDSNLFELDISPSVKIAANIPASALFSFSGTPTQVLPPYSKEITDPDPHGGLVSGGPAFANPAAAFVGTGGGTLSIRVGSSMASVPVTVAPNASLNDIAAAINATANSPVRAQVVDVSNTRTDYRIVIAPVQVGSEDQVSITAAGDASLISSLNYDSAAKSMSRQNNIVNYNYITDTANGNYYNFNNNYLNENNIIRALHFLNEALNNNDQARVRKGIDYLSAVSEKVYQLHAEVGARLNKLDAEKNFLGAREDDTNVTLSNDQDADYSRVVSEMQQRQTALEALRTASRDTFRTSLFDFIR
ncbi:MAG: flagellar hook-associated protein 3 FlgL [Nitrospirae bacterium]|nr:MAG: flagellar hook-associated protein 3 FlgL [Nitrospirota bacterium]